ncbi:MAG: DMT family transporter [Clostridia bacterium]|nr:DMT family transporter [Clostridia bacterium]
MKASLKGTLYVMLSAVLFGIAPLMASWVTQGGSNSATLALLRFVLSLPILFLLALKQMPRPRLPKGAGLPMLGAGALQAATNLLLYASYDYIPSGMCTTLHFVYPLVAAVLTAVFLKRKLGLGHWVGLMVGLGGISLFMADAQGGSFFGAALALLSGLAFGSYVVVIDTKPFKGVPCFVFAFYQALAVIFATLLWAVPAGQIDLHMTASAWAGALGVAILNSVLAGVLLQVGITLVGPASAALLSLLEPLTSVVVGVTLLGDPLPLVKTIGCGLILVGLTLSILLPQRLKFREKRLL